MCVATECVAITVLLCVVCVRARVSKHRQAPGTTQAATGQLAAHMLLSLSPSLPHSPLCRSLAPTPPHITHHTHRVLTMTPLLLLPRRVRTRPLCRCASHQHDVACGVFRWCVRAPCCLLLLPRRNTCTPPPHTQTHTLSLTLSHRPPARMSPRRPASAATASLSLPTLRVRE